MYLKLDFTKAIYAIMMSISHTLVKFQDLKTFKLYTSIPKNLFTIGCIEKHYEISKTNLLRKTFQELFHILQSR